MTSHKIPQPIITSPMQLIGNSNEIILYSPRQLFRLWKLLRSEP